MTDTTTTPAPKKKIFTLKRLFWVIGIALAILGVDRYTLNLVSGGSVALTDSTIVISAPVDTISVITVDTTKV